MDTRVVGKGDQRRSQIGSWIGKTHSWNAGMGMRVIGGDAAAQRESCRAGRLR